MKRVILAGLLLSGLAACQRQSEQAPGESVETGGGNAAAPNLPEPDMNASLETIGAMHPDEAYYRFVGRWAADEASCAGEAWRFTHSELQAPAGAVCRFTNVREVAGGYDVDARCAAEGREQDDELRIRFAESAGGMLIESDRIAEAGLVPCEQAPDAANSQ